MFVKFPLIQSRLRYGLRVNIGLAAQTGRRRCFDTRADHERAVFIRSHYYNTAAQFRGRSTAAAGLSAR
jgi:hypothetical protein